MNYTVASQLTPAQSEALAKAQEADILAAAAMVKVEVADWYTLLDAKQALKDAIFTRDAAAVAFLRTFQRRG